MVKQIVEKYEECFQNIIKNKQIETEGSVDKTWKHIKEIINEARTQILEKTKSKAIPWFKTICEEAV